MCHLRKMTIWVIWIYIFTVSVISRVAIKLFSMQTQRRFLSSSSPPQLHSPPSLGSVSEVWVREVIWFHSTLIFCFSTGFVCHLINIFLSHTKKNPPLTRTLPAVPFSSSKAGLSERRFVGVASHTHTPTSLPCSPPGYMALTLHVEKSPLSPCYKPKGHISVFI